MTIDNSQLYTFNYDTSEERRQLTLEAARKVEEKAPGSALAATAMGHYRYRIERNYDKALEELTRAIELDPNNGTALWIHGSVLRRQAEFEAAAESYQSAIALDPRNAFFTAQLGIVYQYLRRFQEAIDTYDQAIALNEGALTAHHGKVTTYWSWAGHRSAARQAIETFPMQRSPLLGDYLWYWQMVYEGDFQAALDRIQTTREEWLGMPIYYRPRELLERPSRFTISFLRLDPRWAPLWDQPQFKELEERFG